MFGKKKGLKFIRLAGSIKTLPSDFRNVVFRDVDGDEINFQGLVVGKSLLTKLAIDIDCTFYILRYRKDQNLVGALYAVEMDGVKFYSESEAIAACRTLALSNSSRYEFLTGSDALRFTYNALCLGVGSAIFMVCISFAAGPLALFFGPLAIALTATFGLYSWYPLIRKDSYSGIPEMKIIMNESGFETPSYKNSKY